MDDRIAVLRQRIAEAVAWLSTRHVLDDPESGARSAALRPSAYDPAWSDVCEAPVEEVAARRAAALAAQGIVPDPNLAQKGRLLVFDPGQSLDDGAAQAASDCFFDERNAPPWDTWLMFIRESPRAPYRWNELDYYLLCWIPAPLVPMAALGIDVNPEQCLHWADEIDTPFLAQLRKGS